jgi:GNAT superfamily N-acetyltransferase
VSESPDHATVVRRATVDDAHAMADVHVRSWRAAYRGIVPQSILDALSVDRREAFWRDAVAGTTNDPKWVAERGGRVVAFAAIGPARDDDLAPGRGELYAIYVDPDEWAHGVGRRLFAAAVHDLANLGFGGPVLWVLTDNARARRFYEGNGWRADGTSRMLDFDGMPIEEIRYVAPSGTNGPSATPTVDG